MPVLYIEVASFGPDVHIETFDRLYSHQQANICDEAAVWTETGINDDTSLSSCLMGSEYLAGIIGTLTQAANWPVYCQYAASLTHPEHRFWGSGPAHSNIEVS